MAQKLAYACFTHIPKLPHFRQAISATYEGCDFKMRKEKLLTQQKYAPR